MARARNIKPGFFANEHLAECDPLARLLFAGLWCLADRLGRLEDRPKRIRAELLPYDMCDADDLLNQLQRHGFILRYEHGGARFIQVLKFGSHQNPHLKEAKSTIPAPEGFASECDLNDAQTGPAPQEIVPAPDKPGASPVQEPDKAQPLPAPARLNPDSGSLIPDSPILDSVPDGTDGKPSRRPKALVTDPQEIIFGYGLALLTNAGTAEKQARSFLGGLRKQHGDAELVNKLRDCAKAKPLQPLEWLAAALPPASMAPKLNAQEALEAANRAVAERFLAEEAAREAV